MQKNDFMMPSDLLRCKGGQLVKPSTFG